MPTDSLPDEPNLEQLRKQAKDLQRAVRAGDADALAELAERVPDAAFDRTDPASFRLSAGQLAVAAPLRLRELGSTQASCGGDRAVQPLSVTRPGRRARRPGDPVLAGRVPELRGRTDALGRGPGAVGRSPGDRRGERLRRVRRRRRRRARSRSRSRLRSREPGRWTVPLGAAGLPRVRPTRPGDRSRRGARHAARLLVAAGADPNAGYLWHGLPTPFTVLTGVFGEGEQGPVHQPRHPHSLALGPVAARSRRRSERRAGALQPDVRARQRPPRAALRVRSRAPATAGRGGGASAQCSSRRRGWCAAS